MSWISESATVQQWSFIPWWPSSSSSFTSAFPSRLRLLRILDWFKPYQPLMWMSWQWSLGIEVGYQCISAENLVPISLGFQVVFPGCLLFIHFTPKSLTTRPWKWMGERRSFAFGHVTFQGRAVKLLRGSCSFSFVFSWSQISWQDLSLDFPLTVSIWTTTKKLRSSTLRLCNPLWWLVRWELNPAVMS